jgi:DnaJ like chaperone protein
VFQRVCAALGLVSDKPRTPAQNTVAFTVAVISLSAKMAKADGIASAIELDTFERMFRAAPEEIGHVRRLFNLASRDVAGFEVYARQIGALLANDPHLKLDVFAGLFHIAAADGILHPKEDTYLRTVAELLGLTPTDYRVVRAGFIRDSDDPYLVLGVAPNVGDDVLKARYRQLVRDHHPDMAMARGVPAEFVELATRKLASINTAYDQIARERGL